MYCIQHHRIDNSSNHIHTIRLHTIELHIVQVQVRVLPEKTVLFFGTYSNQNPPVTLSPLDLVVGGFHPPDHSRANSMVDQDRLLDMEPDVSTTFLSTMSPHSLMTSSPNATVLRTSTLGSNLLSLPPISQRILDIPLSADTSTDISNTDMNIESIAENTIRNWISSFLQNQPNQFPNIDLDISYTVEYDYTDGSNNSV